MNGRMYDPVIGRVLSPDAFVQAPGYTQSYNRYSYCLNNPLRYTDPSGWLMAPADQYWNLDKDITDFISFSGRRASGDGSSGGGGWGGNGGVVPGGGGFGNFGQQLYASFLNVLSSNAPDGVYNLSSIYYHNGNFGFSFDYNFRATININAAVAYSNAQYPVYQNQRDSYDYNLSACVEGGPGSTNLTFTNSYFKAIIGANTIYTPWSSGKDFLSIGIKDTPFSIVLTSDAKIGVKGSINLYNIVSAEQTEYFSFMNQQRTSNTEVNFPFMVNMDADTWILGVNVNETLNMVRDFMTYPTLVVNQYLYLISHPQTKYGFK